MAYQIPPDVDERINELIESGLYESRDEVIRAAFSAFHRQRVEMAAIQEGIDDMEAGRVIPLREFDREFRKRNNVE